MATPPGRSTRPHPTRTELLRRAELPGEALDAVDSETFRSGRSDWIDAELIGRLAHHPPSSLDTEYLHFVQ